jgi:hypothetical protein
VKRRAADEEKPFVAAEALAAEEAAKPESERVGDDAPLAHDPVFGFDSAFSPRHRRSVPALLSLVSAADARTIAVRQGPLDG